MKKPNILTTDYVLPIVTKAINEIFVDLHIQCNTTQGDISPMQEVELDSLKEQLSELIAQQVNQNITFEPSFNNTELEDQFLTDLQYYETLDYSIDKTVTGLFELTIWINDEPVISVSYEYENKSEAMADVEELTRAEIEMNEVNFKR